jgi:hypothetical protein
MILALLLTQVAAATLSCAPIPGADAILDDPARRYIVMGEMHGTAEAPAIFADLVCAGASRGPVLVGVEYPSFTQPLLDAFLASDGGEAARALLLSADQWRVHDGRSSLAMLDLLDRLRRLKQAGRIVGVVAFVPTPRPGSGQTEYDRAMAGMWTAALGRNPGARLFVLVGNIHALEQSLALQDGSELTPAAMVLPPEQRVTLNAANVGGDAYNMQGATVGPHSMGSGSPVLPRSIRPVEQGDAVAGSYDYLYAPGHAFSASPPAKPK